MDFCKITDKKTGKLKKTRKQEKHAQSEPCFRYDLAVSCYQINRKVSHNQILAKKQALVSFFLVSNVKTVFTSSLKSSNCKTQKIKK